MLGQSVVPNLHKTRKRNGSFEVTVQWLMGMMFSATESSARC
jgi:hypothetical protein